MLHDLSTQKGRNAYMKAMAEQEKLEKYKITIEVRDSEGNIITDDEGVKHMTLSYDVEMLPSNVKPNFAYLGRTLKAFMPDRKINIEAYVRNSISGTYMNMFSYYVDEKRFVKH